MKTMRVLEVVLVLFSLSSTGFAGEWNLLSYITNKGEDNKYGNLDFSLKNYCESWRMNVELNNIRGFEVVPRECVTYIGAYMTSTQYKVDVQLAAEESVLFLTDDFQLSGDGNDAWVFDVDDVLLSTVPYFKMHDFGGSKIDKKSFEEWMKEGNAPAVEHIAKLFHHIRGRGLKVFILSSRPEYLREATIENLIAAGYHGWSDLILRSEEDDSSCAEEYKAKERTKLVHDGYRLWGIVGSQWSSLGGYTTARRIFKLPNPMYYVY
ncbi:acid phosphatase 1-like [Canna indica]|uniref:Acid phosphatase 1-like n=1 Tax=Canna indica TaxID=4628 RepID=A0AAQ3JUR6_9LILI|nr:acid phosphatase 1-like [Canna indica]